MRSTSKVRKTANAVIQVIETLETRRLFNALVVNSTADDAVAGDGQVTLREAIIAANGDTTTDLGHTGSGADEITFDLGAGAHTIDLATALPTLNSDLSIVGPGTAGDLTVQRSGAGAFRIFGVASGRTVTLENMTITNGNLTSSDGGGVFNGGGNLTVRGCLIHANSARFGGGIANVSGGTMELIGTTVLNNTATIDGGGINNFGSTATLTHSNVDGNFASRFGGGITNSTNATLTLVDSGFSYNTALDDSGGIDNFSNSAVSLTRTTLIGNSAADTGGAITNKPGCTLLIDQCGFYLNGSAHGGAIMNRGLLDAQDTLFQSNSSGYGAGALDNDGGTETVRRCIFASNFAAFGGGAMWNHVNSNATVLDCVFNTNLSGEGGAIENRQGANLTIERCNFIFNQAYQLGGGAIFNYFGNISITDSTFWLNYGGWDGGAINNNHVLQITGCTFYDNYAPHGGALFNWYTGSMSVTSSTIARNSAGNAGGGIMNHGAAQLKFITVADNSPGNSGVGAGLTNEGGSFSLSHSVIARNVGDDFYSDNSNFAGSHNFVGDRDGDPMLGQLADNGGPTLTIMPLPGSPLVNAGDPLFAGTPNSDQRGFARFGDGQVDIGAVEVYPPTTSGIADVVTTEDAPDHAIYLDGSFDDFEDGAAGLSYSIVNNTNPSLFASLWTDDSTGYLTLDYADDQHGVAEITVRATDRGGWSVDTTFTVTVLSVEQQVDLLVAQLEALPGLNQGNLNSLLVNLDLKQNAGDAGKVGAFINHVQSLASEGKIASSDADDLLAAAAELLASLA